jgi:hypothetical protein
MLLVHAGDISRIPSHSIRKAVQIGGEQETTTIQVNGAGWLDFADKKTMKHRDKPCHGES